jgi:hypothetical protein
LRHILPDGHEVPLSISVTVPIGDAEAPSMPNPTDDMSHNDVTKPTIKAFEVLLVLNLLVDDITFPSG